MEIHNYIVVRKMKPPDWKSEHYLIKDVFHTFRVNVVTEHDLLCRKGDILFQVLPVSASSTDDEGARLACST